MLVLALPNSDVFLIFKPSLVTMLTLSRVMISTSMTKPLPLKLPFPGRPSPLVTFAPATGDTIFTTGDDHRQNYSFGMRLSPVIEQRVTDFDG